MHATVASMMTKREFRAVRSRSTKTQWSTISARIRVLGRVLGTFLLCLIVFADRSAFPQKNKSAATPAPPLLVHTTTRHEAARLGYGGTVTVIGAPQGSITVEGWSRSEVDLTATIELQAPTEADLNRLAAVNNFIFDADANHISILTTGTHDRTFMRRVAKDFPKQLLGLPWKIDYRLRVPAVTDLEINGGRGAISVKGVEGAFGITSPQSAADLTLTGGTVSATIATGTINLHIPVRSWHGSGAMVQLAAGLLYVDLPTGFNGDIDADVLRTGQVDNTFSGLEARDRSGTSPRSLRVRGGSGGAAFKFTVGDGTIAIKPASVSPSQ